MVLFSCYNELMKKLFLILITILSLICSACGSANGDATPLEEKAPVTIAIIDTGFSTKAIPAENIVPGKNYLYDALSAKDTSDQGALSTEDTYGHGTAVASVILNICPEAKLVPLISNAYDNGKIIQVENDVFAQIIRDAVDVYDCDIINISAGLILDKDSVREAIAYAEEHNVLVVASVGNDYQDDQTTYYPAAYETVLAVGSTDKAGNISTFSQRGEWVDLYTCGEDVEISTLSGNKRTSEGTSYSAAKVSAYAALLLQADASLPVDSLREALKHEDNVIVFND